MTKEDIQDALRACGLQGSMDDEGDLVFRHQGLPFWVRHEDESADFASVCTQVLYTVGLSATDGEVRALLMQVNRRMKAAKAVLLQREGGRSGVLLAVEQFATAEDFRRLLPRCLETLLLMRQVIYDELRALEAGHGPADQQA